MSASGLAALQDAVNRQYMAKSMEDHGPSRGVAYLAAVPPHASR
jgi:hypothetical protein